MDKQKISKILIITSIATGISLSGAFLIYKHNKDNKQYKRNSNSNFSITIHLSKDLINKDNIKDEDQKEFDIIEGEEEEEEDIKNYFKEFQYSEEKNFFVNLFDKFINIFSSKEDLSVGNDTVIITKPNEAILSTLDDNVEIDENNDTIIITKPNEAPLLSPIEGRKENIKILNEVIEKTIHSVNHSGNESDDSIESIKNNFNKKAVISSSPSTPSHPFNYPSTSSSFIQHSNNNINTIVNTITTNEPLSVQSSSSTLVGRHEFSDDLQTNSYYDNSFTMKMPNSEIIDAESGSEGEIEDNISDIESHSPNTPIKRNRKETITNFNYKRNEELFDSENELVAPSTPKMNFADRTYSSQMLPVHRTPQFTSNSKNTIDNDSINPLSIDINKILMSQNFEFSDEEDNDNTTTSDTINHFMDTRKNEKSLHRASSISSTSTYQSAISSWNSESQSVPEDQTALANDDKWEVNSTCSSTSGFYSAQEDFFDANFE
ncbi:hypothetical protein BCR36DRAFT_406726 [Piromyces finnis]|uniref:Uncharacterized protein n=1 Tax=Piromyces finnis TaxID=1754191 RepID=A0A1Y1UYU1_9FUNG|nr:hypothetical protein BCR36DRAFT_406726 [Piromyces finnis]|eukprot:ORX43511.1 hypothetical protein BCR36DRAFT_406726 [Piromyces finnis]